MKLSNQIEYEILPKVADFVPEWPLDKLVDRNCPLCGSRKETLFLRSDNLPAAYCDSCELWFINKIPDKKVIYETYDQYYKTIRPVKFDDVLAEQIKKNTKRVLKSADYDVRIKKLISIAGDLKGKQILEIGCGTGEFLYYLSALGADVIGCDLSKEACDFINNYLQIKVFHGGIEDNAEKIGKVDIVLLNDVIEHFIDPLKTLEKINLLLNKDGMIIIWTPNGSNAGKTLECARNWIGFSIDLEHLQYFSYRTISKIADKFNFDIVHLESLGYPCLDKLKDFKPSGFKQMILEIRFRLSVFLSGLLLGRVIKSILKEFFKSGSTEMGQFVLFVILRKTN